MANESLIFRKGLQANLADTTKCPIRPGAISITIDEPGMYIDLPANADLGHSSDYRVRIGDVITVQTLGELADLNNLTPDNLSADGVNSLNGRMSAYSSSALYYVTDKNLLLKYDGVSKFIWINDTSTLQSSITNLTSTVTNQGQRLTALEAEVGDPKSDTNATATGLYKVIEDAAKTLQDQIDGLAGGGDGLSLDSLNKALTQEIKDRQAGDSTIDEKVTGLTTRMGTAESAIDDLEELVGTKDDASNVSTVFGAIKKEAERADTAEKALSGRLDTIEGYNIPGTYATKIELTEVVSSVSEVSQDLADLTNTVNTNKTNIEESLAEEVSRAQGAESSLSGRIKTIEDLDIDNTYAKKDTVESLTSSHNTLKNLVGTKTDSADKETAFGYIAKETARAQGIEGDHETRIAAIEGLSIANNYATKAELNELKDGAVKQNSTAITNLTTNLDTNYYKKSETYSADEVDELVGGANTAAANALKDAKAYTDSEIDKVEQAFANADTALDEKITNINNSLVNYATTASLESTTETLTQAIADAQTDAETNATAAAKNYTDSEIDKVEKAFADADEVIDEKITNLSGSVYKKTETYNRTEIDNKVKAVSDTVAGLDEQWTADITAAVGAEAAAREEAINGANGVATKLAAHMESATATYETKADATAKLSEAKTHAETKANAAQSAAETNAKNYADGLDTQLRTDFAAADAALLEKINSNTGAFANYYKKSETYSKGEVNGLIQEAKDYADDAVENVLRAAEAMRYMGTLTSNDIAAELAAKTGVEAGDVWVVGTAAMDLTDGYHPGDMFIASKDGASAIADWNHVKTGYDANLEQKFHSTVETNGGKVALDSIGTLDTGSIAFKASADTDGNYTSAIRVTMTTDSAGTGNHGVAIIGMVWEDF